MGVGWADREKLLPLSARLSALHLPGADLVKQQPDWVEVWKVRLPPGLRDARACFLSVNLACGPDVLFYDMAFPNNKMSG